MRFREYDNLLPKTVAAHDPEELDAKIERLAEKYDFIDLQFAMTDCQYSALALLREKERE